MQKQFKCEINVLIGLYFNTLLLHVPANASSSYKKCETGSLWGNKVPGTAGEKVWHMVAINFFLSVLSWNRDLGSSFGIVCHHITASLTVGGREGMPPHLFTSLSWTGWLPPGFSSTFFFFFYHHFIYFEATKTCYVKCSGEIVKAGASNTCNCVSVHAGKCVYFISGSRFT